MKWEKGVGREEREATDKFREVTHCRDISYFVTNGSSGVPALLPVSCQTWGSYCASLLI